jgi:hypothetical protein
VGLEAEAVNAAVEWDFGVARRLKGVCSEIGDFGGMLGRDAICFVGRGALKEYLEDARPCTRSLQLDLSTM